MFFFLMLTLFATVSAGSAGAYIMLLPFTIIIMNYSFKDPFKATMCYFCFLSYEGMYRYLSSFAQYSYFISPFYAIFIIYVAFNKGFLVVNSREKLPYAVIFIFIILIGFLQIFNPSGAGVISGVATFVVWYLFPMMMYPLLFNIKKNKNDLILFLLILIVVSVSTSIVALLQYSQGETWMLQKFPGSEKANKMGIGFHTANGVERGAFRPVGTGTQRGAYAAWSRLGMLPGFLFLTLPNSKNIFRIIGLGSIAINLFAIFISGTRTSLIMSIIDIILYLIFSSTSLKSIIRSSIILIVSIVFFRIAFSAASSNTDGFISQRFEGLLTDPTTTFQRDRGANIDIIGTLAMTVPFGVGYTRGTEGGGAVTDSTQNRETQFSALIYDWGVPGMALMFLINIFIVVSCVRSGLKLKDPVLKLTTMTCGAFIGTHLIEWFGGPILQANYIHWFSAGIGLSLSPLVVLGRAKPKSMIAPVPTIDLPAL